MYIQYTNERAIVQGESIALALQAYLAKKGIPKNQVARRMTISAPGLHYLLTGKNELTERRIREIAEILGIEIRLNGKVAIHEFRDAEIRDGRKITRNNLNEMENRFWEINSDLIDLDDHEIPVFELQEYLLETKTGIAMLLSQLSKTEKSRIESIGYGRNLTDKMRDLHMRNGELIPDPMRLLELAIRAHIRAHIGDSVKSLQRTPFPGGYSWGLETVVEVPF